MTVSKMRAGSSKSLISNNRLPSDVNVEVEGVDVEVLKYFMRLNSR
jgi:hypothetical protein